MSLIDFIEQKIFRGLSLDDLNCSRLQLVLTNRRIDQGCHDCPEDRQVDCDAAARRQVNLGGPTPKGCIQGKKPENYKKIDGKNWKK